MVLEKIIQNIGKKVITLGLVGALSLGAVGVVQGQQTLQDQKHYFACEPRGFDGYVPYLSTEKKVFIGLRNPIILIGHNPSSKTTDSARIEIYGPSGKMILSGEGHISKDGMDFVTNIPPMILTYAGYGKYTVKWFSNGREEGVDDFTVSQ